MLYSQAGNKDVFHQSIKETTNTLIRHNEQASERALKYLLYTNAGGAVTLAGYVGTAQQGRLLTMPVIALSCFVVGIFLAGALVAYGFHNTRTFLKVWGDNVRAFYGDKITWDDLYGELKKRERFAQIIAIGYLSFAAFIAGSIAALYGLLTVSVSQ